ncbi:DUF1573 domain-containing protein [Reichenbachiella carrageenanivorans]|uniref:DUF1573 domain-containing protein n=1 Tax=Reichenbachiella carrageenanivorans TaxID=2979869 RepID=A0ABY6D2D9_9BACT|nr:DUF1573 domain-containing protein [Reichenbachiella carrageenanivorans]UXX80079.1 DUF1573 domain-containing protein [Reichenbachiella carrageenanivorans]
MKSIKLIPVFVAVVAMIATGCSSGDVESRIARLEGRVAELEGSGTAAARSTSTQPAATAEPEVKPEGPLPAFTFNEESHDFGTINEGDEVEHIFAFTNTGDAPLIISSATGSCGCTVPEWPKEPIGIGEKGEIKVKFNSRKKPGIQNKTVTITSNTYPKQTRIKIKANVTPAPKDANSPS